jgi:hypothetical protein
MPRVHIEERFSVAIGEISNPRTPNESRMTTLKKGNVVFEGSERRLGVIDDRKIEETSGHFFSAHKNELYIL